MLDNLVVVPFEIKWNLLETLDSFLKLSSFDLHPLTCSFVVHTPVSALSSITFSHKSIAYSVCIKVYMCTLYREHHGL